MARRPFTISIFLPDGSPEGLRIIEKSNWSGAGIVCPRALLGDAKQRPEFGRTGVYVLIAEHCEMPRIYIGEGDPILPRLRNHGLKKDFWTTLIAFTSKDRNLNKAHVQYLEARLINIATEANRCELENGTKPQLPSLSESAEAEAEVFLEEMLLCFPVLGLSIFEKPQPRAPKALELHLTSKGIKATGYESAQGFIVKKGSTAVLLEVPSLQPSISELRKNFIQKGILKIQNGHAKLSQDYAFSSPSTAAKVFLGRSANGRDEWQTLDGRTLKEVQDMVAIS